MNTSAKAFILSLCFLLFGGQVGFAQAQKTSAATTYNSISEQKVINLSKKKWRWMAEKKVDSLAILFDEKAVLGNHIARSGT